MMEEIQLLEAVEKYIRGEMTPEEKIFFEQLRSSNPEVDQLVVEQTMFFKQLGDFSNWKNYKSTLHEIHNQLYENGEIKEIAPKGIVREIWKKYKKVMAVAATIAGITTLLIATSVSLYTRKQNNEVVQNLRIEFKNEVAKKSKETLDKVEKKIEDKAPKNVPIKSGGTGFLIDGKGFLITNAHVVKGSSSVLVQNNKGQEFHAVILHINSESDLAILKIEDKDYKSVNALPYSIRKTGSELGEQLFTLGYPRNEIVYNEGYMSAKTGYQGDTMTCQIGVPANPGNSGGPVFNKNGEVIGIINTRQLQAEGVVFAVTSKNIFRILDEVKKVDSSVKNVKLPFISQVKNLERTQQIKKIEDCVFMVKSY
ncbi:MAG: S1C family serine protease [Chitinophagaceae bacterium]